MEVTEGATVFEAAEVGHKVDKQTYKREEPEVHHQLLQLQMQLRETKRAVVIIVSGVEGAGKGEVVDALNRWFDTRDVVTHAYFDDTDEERERPFYWRFLRTLPPHGTVAVMFGSWYTQTIVKRALGETEGAYYDRRLQDIAELERMLVRDGTIIVKLWFHLSKKEQQKRLKADVDVAQLKKSPELANYAKLYKKFAEASEQAIRMTDTGAAPWHIIEATNRRYRDLTTGQILIDFLSQRLPAPPQADPLPAHGKPYSSATVLDTIDLSQTLIGDEYKQRLKAAQQELHDLSWQMHHAGKNAVLVFEGWDAAGKGSAIRRVTSAVDARLYRVIPVAAPTDEELARHYLWRFWRHIPRSGYITIYDRSWYGRVLVERVEGFASEEEWLRSYHEINDFETHLAKHGAAVMKFWVHISAEEQLARFKAREDDPRKKHKITDEDWRNREKWQDYEQAVNDMVAHTSTTLAPWTLIAGNDKHFARVQILDTINARLRDLLGK